MGWLGAIGEGMGTGVDRYSQWRQLDQENTWKRKEMERQAMLDAENAREAGVRLKSLQRSLTKGELEDAIAPLAPGAVADEATFAKASAAGGGHLFDPATRTFRGTWDQQQTLTKNKRDEDLFGMQKREGELRLGEAQRQAEAVKQFAEWTTANPKADTRTRLGVAGQLGLSELPVGLKEDLDYERALKVAGINSQAEIARLNYAQKLQEDSLTKQRAAQLGQDYKTMPKSINELYAERAAEYIKNTKEQPGPELQAQVIMEWAGLQPRLAQVQRDLKMPTTVNEAPAGSPYYQQELAAIPRIAMAISQGDLDPERAMAEINNDKTLTGSEMVALRNQLRSYLQPLGVKMPAPYTGNEAQTPQASASPTIRGTSPLTSAILRNAVGNGR